MKTYRQFREDVQFANDNMVIEAKGFGEIAKKRRNKLLECADDAPEDYLRGRLEAHSEYVFYQDAHLPAAFIGTFGDCYWNGSSFRGDDLLWR